MRVADRHAERVGGVGAGHAGEVEQPHHHLLHLFLGRAAVTDHGLLQLQRRIFGDRHATRHQSTDRRAARLAEQQSGLRIDVDEHFFDRRLIRRVLADQRRNAFEDGAETRRQIGVGGLDDAARDVAERVAVLIDHAEAGHAQAGVDAENSHEVPQVR